MTQLRLATALDDRPYLRELACRQLAPLILVEQVPLKEHLQQTGGAAAFSVPDPYRPDQVILPLYIGFTTPANNREAPHWHTDQAEAYYLAAGEAQMWGKYRWDDDGWVVKTVRAGDLIVAQPGVCHYFLWLSADGLALVFKNQRPGVGRFPAGKTTCEHCPHFGCGCSVPAAFPVPPSKAA